MDSIRELVPVVREAGRQAVWLQKSLQFDSREFKADGSVVTSIDRQTEEFLCYEIAKLFPETNFITEEFSRPFDPSRRWNFAIDPIDGTDNFSQGMHIWCISVGLLDASLKPVAGLIYAPRLELFLFADIGLPAEINDLAASKFNLVRELTSLSGLVVSSRVHQLLDLRAFPGKLRTLGSAALHMAFPLCYPGLIGTLQESATYAWDIAGAHAILQSMGYEICYWGGAPVDYARMRDHQWKLENLLFAGLPGYRKLLENCLAPRP